MHQDEFKGRALPDPLGLHDRLGRDYLYTVLSPECLLCLNGSIPIFFKCWHVCHMHNVELRRQLGSEDVAKVVQWSRLRWYGHVL